MPSIQSRLDECCVNAMSIILGMSLIRDSTYWTGSLKTMSLMATENGLPGQGLIDMKLSNEDLDTLAGHCEKLSMEIRKMHSLLKKGQSDALLAPAHVVRILCELASWANQLNVEVLNTLDKQIKQQKKERKK
jgi:hypothetical protein